MNTVDLLDTAPCGFVRFGEDGTVELINQTLLDTLGYDRADLVGRHVERILTIGTRIFYQTHWFPLLRLHGRAEEIFLMLRSRAGEDVGVLTNAVRREIEGRAAYDCVCFLVRERKKFEDELLRLKREAERLRAAAEEANRAKSRFLAVMSHELRTPLNAIAGYVQILELGIHGPVTTKQVEALGRIARSQAHLLRLINDVLDLSRIEAGRVEYVLEDVPLVEVTAAVVPMVEPQFLEKRLELSTRVPVDLVARADREKAQQILLNLLGNAVKFTPAPGRIAVVAELAEGGTSLLRLHVRDSGIGIPEEELESIFEPFVQAEGARGDFGKGSGLGLAISRDLARGMGGDLTVVSAPGAGSTFTLSLPAAGGARDPV